MKKILILNIILFFNLNIFSQEVINFNHVNYSEIGDSCILNNTKLNIKVIFDIDVQTALELGFIETLYNSWEVGVDNDTLIIDLKNSGFIKIFTNNSILYSKMRNNSYDTLETIKFETNRFFTEKSILPYYLFDTTFYNFEIGNANVIRHKMFCDDTGMNSIIIRNNSNELSFNKIGNIKLFEYDFDKDCKKELFVCRYIICGGILRIYLVND